MYSNKYVLYAFVAPALLLYRIIAENTELFVYFLQTFVKNSFCLQSNNK